MSEPRPPLRAADLDPDPVRQFGAWFDEAGAVMAAPEAAAVATAAPDGRPSVRMVLVKRADERGFVFYTNYESRKALELTANPFASLLFYWTPLDRQVRIEGPVARVAPEESAAYITSRARASQLSALASPQSRPVDSREILERRVAELAERYAGADLPVPEHWGGFRVVPEAIEFWQQGTDRLHDRFRYTRRDEGGWGVQRLAP